MTAPVKIAALRTLAIVEAASAAETVFGGRSRTWSQAAAIWIDLKPRGLREAAEAGGRPELIETAEAEARRHPGVTRGMRLKAGGEPWRIVAVLAGGAGRMTLKLERRWP